MEVQVKGAPTTEPFSISSTAQGLAGLKATYLTNLEMQLGNTGPTSSDCCMQLANRPTSSL